MKRYDTAIIGFGKGGKTLAGALGAAGQDVALIEQSSLMYGGSCINVACIPTKTLIRAAAISQAHGGGFEARAKRYRAAIEEKNRVSGILRAKNYRKAADMPGVDVLDGHASFIDADRLALSPVRDTAAGAQARQIEADRIVINTGARPFVPPIPGADSPRVFVSETMIDSFDLPRRLVIVGGGYIGLEFASMYANFGSQVSIVQDDERFVPREDAEIAQCVRESLEARGVRVVLGARIERISHEKDCDRVIVAHGGSTESLEADAVLMATGRRPNVEGLNLEAAGVRLSDRAAVQADEHLRTSAPNIWAMGDVVGGLQFTYISLDDSRIVKDALLGEGRRTTENRGAVPYSVFIDPPFSRVGLGEQEARDQGHRIRLATLPVAAIPKTLISGNAVGLLKAVVDADSDRLLGVHLFCDESHELINTAKLALDEGLPYQRLRDGIYTHPTMSESFNELFASLHEEADAS